MEKKQLLADALQLEYDTLPEICVFGCDNQKWQYKDAIHYLRTGETQLNLKGFNDLLSSCIEDIEIMYSDYGINTLK